ncbi:unnamed protein product [Ectocarpus fasciculatus]
MRGLPCFFRLRLGTLKVRTCLMRVGLARLTPSVSRLPRSAVTKRFEVATPCESL